MATGLTDANGNVSFTNVTAGVHSLVVNKQPYNQSSTTINVTANGQVFTVTLTGGAVLYTITIHAQNTQGTPLDTATVDLT